MLLINDSLGGLPLPLPAVFTPNLAISTPKPTQRVTMTRWGVAFHPPPSHCQPPRPTSHHDSLGGPFAHPRIHSHPPPPTSHGDSLGGCTPPPSLPPPTTSPNESPRLVGRFFCPPPAPTANHPIFNFNIIIIYFILYLNLNLHFLSSYLRS